jgi:hypothetical protein
VVNVFSHFSLPQISSVARRTALGAAIVGAAALVGLSLLGYALAGVGVCIGLALALGNFRLIAASTVKAASSAQPDKRRPLVMSTLGRLGVVSVIALGLVFLQRELGFGALLGLAVFQFMLLGNVVVAMLRDPSMGTGPGVGTSGDDT